MDDDRPLPSSLPAEALRYAQYWNCRGFSQQMTAWKPRAFQAGKSEMTHNHPTSQFNGVVSNVAKGARADEKPDCPALDQIADIGVSRYSVQNQGADRITLF
jgi:hypothetical protein